MTIRAFLACGLLIPTAMILQASPAAAQDDSGLFELIDLGTLSSGDSSGATDVNGPGLVTGIGDTNDGRLSVVHAFLWEGKPKLIDLGTLRIANETLFDESRARAINDAGRVVGHSTTGELTDEARPQAVEHAFLWDTETGMIDLGTLGGDFSEAFDINSAGEVVGDAQDASFDNRAFLWTPAAAMSDLGTFGGGFSRAVAINEASEVAGLSQNPEGFLHAFLWTESTGIVDLGEAQDIAGINDLGQVAGDDLGVPFIADLGGRESLPILEDPEFPSSRVEAINNLGVSAGFSGDSEQAVLWRTDGTIINLGTLGGSFSRATDINDAGQVVGFSETADGSVHAFFWSEETGMVDLGVLSAPPDDSEAVGINDSALIIGESRDKDGSPHAVVWEPVGLEQPAVRDDVQDAISLIGLLVEEDRLAPGIARSLESKLLAINDALQRGQNTAAGNLIEATIIQIEALASAGQIDGDTADDLVAALQAIAV